MHRYIPDLASRSVPRYTSYPTAAEFHDRVGALDQAAALDGVAAGTPVSLYVHIPYCHEICWYCGCNTGAVGRPERMAAYLGALDREIDAVAARLRGRVVAVHFGGGSPNAMPAGDFIALTDRLRARFDCADRLEIAAELDPRTLDAAYCDALAAAGVTRVSLGAQTFARNIQEKINRVQPYAMVARAVADLRAAGIAAVNLDLMYGLPGQGADDLAETLDLALDLTPDRIAMFGYAHMPRLLPRQRMIDDALLPDAAARFAQSALAHDVLVGAGYAAIGFDHFARATDSLAVAGAEGRLRRNFQGFTDEPGEAIIGLGASSISQYPGLLVQNEKHVGRYRLRAANGGLAGARGIVRSADDRLRGAIIERLLCDGTVDLSELARAHGACLGPLHGALARLGDLAARDLVRVRGWRVTVPEQGRAYARLVAAAFDVYRQPDALRFSRAV
ncbi:oxygen-independent coproporphyrinogen III oxidase [Sphingomonas sp. NFR15]|uniref:oxygen-independent coproporphyrinogen III oxidase n=1 Tax=Sphingomonas sp. NFR15 TaxID=1566282 RepID=UPI000884579A|nr:oxygen-independent coproporphyrinogen III oxidase [Sphingomonas sp. NFR15]SDA30151.1 oxygen-independent coproporphyrinogen-3 oxidase [Sphingomonas sp. NFR15]